MKEKYLTIIHGKGTKLEKRVKTKIKLYWSEILKKWVSIPGREN